MSKYGCGIKVQSGKIWHELSCSKHTLARYEVSQNSPKSASKASTVLYGYVLDAPTTLPCPHPDSPSTATKSGNNFAHHLPGPAAPISCITLLHCWYCSFLNRVQCTEVYCTLHSAQCTVHSAHCTVHSVQCTLSSCLRAPAPSPRRQQDSLLLPRFSVAINNFRAWSLWMLWRLWTSIKNISVHVLFFSSTLLLNPSLVLCRYFVCKQTGACSCQLWNSHETLRRLFWSSPETLL